MLQYVPRKERLVMPQIKIFTNTSTAEVEKMVNEWLKSNRKMISVHQIVPMVYEADFSITVVFDSRIEDKE